MAETVSRVRTSPVRRALKMLDLFTPEVPVWGVSEIARRMGLPKSNVSRLLTDLRAEGYVEQDGHRRYRLATHLYSVGLASLRGHRVYAAALPAVIELHRESRMSAHLALLDGVDVVHVERLRSERMFEFIGGRTLSSPIHATCTGKLLVAYAAAATRERVIAAGLPRFSAATITDAAAFRSELQQIRECGYAVDRQEYMSGLGAASAPIFDSNGDVVAALAVVGDERIIGEGARERTINLVRRIARSVAI